MVLRNAIDRIADSARSAATAASDAVAVTVTTGRNAGEAVVGAGTRFADTVADTRDAVFDTVADTRDTVVGVAKGIYSFTTGAISFLAAVGVVVAVVVAPVPTAIGLTLIELLAIGASFTAAGVSAELLEKRVKRENGRLIAKLAKYGVIPSTALINTDVAKFRLDIGGGTITGTLKTGMFSKRDIDTMTVEELTAYARHTDAETASLLEAYLKFREARAAR